MQILSLASVGPRTGLCSLGSLLFFLHIAPRPLGCDALPRIRSTPTDGHGGERTAGVSKGDGTRLSRSVCFHDIFAQGVNAHGLAFHLPK